MINNILKAIDEKAQEEITKILQEKERFFSVLEQEYSLAIEAKEKQQRDLALKKVAKEIEDFEKTLQLKFNFKIQEEKNKIVKEIYEKAQENISGLGEVEFKKLIKHLASYLPQNKKGHIEAGERTAKVLHGLVDSEIKLNDTLKEEGFIFKSHDVEIDLRISQVLFQLQETANPELIKILFS